MSVLTKFLSSVKVQNKNIPGKPSTQLDTTTKSPQNKNKVGVTPSKTTRVIPSTSPPVIADLGRCYGDCPWIEKTKPLAGNPNQVNANNDTSFKSILIAGYLSLIHSIFLIMVMARNKNSNCMIQYHIDYLKVRVSVTSSLNICLKETTTIKCTHLVGGSF